MEKFMQGVKRFIRDEEGVTAIEYALIAALIAVGIIASLGPLKTAINATFDYISGQLDAARGA